MSHEKRTVPDEVVRLYDHFTHGGMDRRAFMEKLTKVAGSATAAAAFIPLLQSNYAMAQTVAPDDPRLAFEDGVTIPGGDAGLKGYLVVPKGGVKRPALLMIHENRGLNPHIRDMTRRGALAGYLTLGIDALSPEGGTPANEDQAREMFSKLNPDIAAARCAAAVRFLANHPQSTGKVGAMGFCWGGWTGQPDCGDRARFGGGHRLLRFANPGRARPQYPRRLDAALCLEGRADQCRHSGL